MTLTQTDLAEGWRERFALRFFLAELLRVTEGRCPAPQPGGTYPRSGLVR
jgi:hypothetical protein